MVAQRSDVQILIEKKFHELSISDISELNISVLSKYKDMKWRFIETTPGAKNPSINWNTELYDGSKLGMPQNYVYLQWGKLLLASLLFAPHRGKTPAIGSIKGIFFGIKCLISWMSDNFIRNISQLTPDVIQMYIEDLPAMLVEMQDSEELSTPTVSTALSPLKYLWEQKDVLSSMGITPLPKSPFVRKKIKAIASEIATKKDGWIEPLPDEISIPLYNKAAWFLQGPADDILRLQDVVLKARPADGKQVRRGHGNRPYVNAGTSLCAMDARQRAAMEAFRFSTLPGENVPWYSFDEHLDDNGVRVSLAQQSRFLLTSLRNACCILIQGTTGVRISELCAMEPGISELTMLPRCITKEKAVSGLNEIFIFSSLLTKEEELARRVRWVIGMRPEGANEVPLPVEAIRVLNKMYSPYQPFSNEGDPLLLTFSNGTGIPHANRRLIPISSNELNRSMQDFVTAWIDLSQLPDTSARAVKQGDLICWRERKGKNFRSHMNRKTWASFIIAVDQRLLPVIQMQFHHAAMAITDSGYIGCNPVQSEPLEAVSRQQCNLLMLEAATGSATLAGRAGERLEEWVAGIKAELGNASSGEAWKKIIEFSDDNQFPLFFARHGKCLPRSSSTMECRKGESNVYWLPALPNLTNREPSICAGCDSFLLDMRHKEFWLNRYIENSVSYEIATLMDNADQFRVIKSRAEQSKKLLIKLGVDLTDYNIEIENEVESWKKM